MDNLLPYYERELALLRESLGAFALRHPKIAARFAVSDGHAEDIHVERLVQSFALLGARIGEVLDDDIPAFTHALLGTLDPATLRPFPACSIARFEPGDAAGQLTTDMTVPRGTQLESRVGACRFRTAYDVVLTALTVADARYGPPSNAPSHARLPERTAGILSIGFTPSQAERPFPASVAPTVRLHLHGDPMLVAALNDALLLRASASFIEVDRDGRWKPLAKVPLAAAGFDAHDALATPPEYSHPAARLLGEYLAFPAKFAFVDLDFARLARAAGPCRHLTLHLPISGAADDAPALRALDAVAAAHLNLFCTPIVNLFELDGAPIAVKPGVAHYPVAPQTLRASGVDVHSVDAVGMLRRSAPGSDAGTPVPPYWSLGHGRAASRSACFWIAETQGPADCALAITLVDLDGKPTAPDADQLSLRLTCSNGDRPRTLPYGAPDGDLLNEKDNLAARIAMLRPASPRQSPRQGRGAHWRLIAGLAPHVVMLLPAGLAALKGLLLRGNAGDAPQIEGIVDLTHRAVMQWMAVKPVSTFVRGVEITLTLDEAAFVASSLHTFAVVMDEFFAPYAPHSGFIQIVLRGRGSRRELCRRPPRMGEMPLL